MWGRTKPVRVEVEEIRPRALSRWRTGIDLEGGSVTEENVQDLVNKVMTQFRAQNLYGDYPPKKLEI